MTPKRSTVTRLALYQSKKKVKVTQTHCFVSQSGTILCSLLSAGTPLKHCSTRQSLELDTRATKEPPKVDKRTAKPTGMSEKSVGRGTKEKVSSHWQSLTTAGLLS